MANIALILPVVASAFTGGTITSPLAAPNGTVGAPAYAFSSDATTGSYLVSAGTLGLAAAGFLAAQLSSTGATSTLQVGTGTADSAGTILLGAAGSASALRLRKNGTGPSVLVESATGGNATLTVANMVFSGSLAAGTGGLFTMQQMEWLYNSKTGPYTVLTNTTDVGQVFDNQGAGSQVVFTLGAVNYSGSQITFFNQNAFGIQIKAGGTDKIRFPGADSTAGGTQTTTTIGASVTLIRTAAGIWSAVGAPGGTWVAA
jgi:hypothetical protein